MAKVENLAISSISPALHNNLEDVACDKLSTSDQVHIILYYIVLLANLILYIVLEF